MKLVEMVLRSGWRGMKENDGGDESNSNTLYTHI
jgi:hypothetical protein